MIVWRYLAAIAAIFNFVVSESNVGDSNTDTKRLDQQVQDQTAPPLNDSVIEIHEVLLTVDEAFQLPQSPRRVQENTKLQHNLNRKNGRWNSNHPRHRILDALHGFSKYLQKNVEDLDRWRKLYKNVSKKQKSILEKTTKYMTKFHMIEDRLERNHRLCQDIISAALPFYGIDQEELQEHIKHAEKDGRQADKTSVSQTLKHFVRDWSEDGASERHDAFPCILESLAMLFPSRLDDGGDAVRVLLPGSGLGRLGHEISRLGGFEVTNNEWSSYMNVAYRFLESQGRPHSHTAWPFVDSWSHHISTADMLREVKFPDTTVKPNDVLLVEGDFTTEFLDVDKFDVVVTHFFIDTARNLMNYFDAIKDTLRPGGYWINFGPLLYGTGPWVQLSLDEIVVVVEEMGFKFLDTDDSCGDITIPGKKIRSKHAVYSFDARALTRNAYSAQFWVARKL